MEYGSLDYIGPLDKSLKSKIMITKTGENKDDSSLLKITEKNDYIDKKVFILKTTKILISKIKRKTP